MISKTISLSSVYKSSSQSWLVNNVSLHWFETHLLSYSFFKWLAIFSTDSSLKNSRNGFLRVVLLAYFMHESCWGKARNVRSSGSHVLHLIGFYSEAILSSICWETFGGPPRLSSLPCWSWHNKEVWPRDPWDGKVSDEQRLTDLFSSGTPHHTHLLKTSYLPYSFLRDTVTNIQLLLTIELSYRFTKNDKKLVSLKNILSEAKE